MDVLATCGSCGTWMWRPRNLKVLLPTNGSVSPAKVRLGLKVEPFEPWIAREKHFGTFAFIPDHPEPLLSHGQEMLVACCTTRDKAGVIGVLEEVDGVW